METVSQYVDPLRGGRAAGTKIRRRCIRSFREFCGPLGASGIVLATGEQERGGQNGKRNKAQGWQFHLKNPFCFFDESGRRGQGPRNDHALSTGDHVKTGRGARLITNLYEPANSFER
jgi:hypothetical protein